MSLLLTGEIQPEDVLVKMRRMEEALKDLIEASTDLHERLKHNTTWEFNPVKDALLKAKSVLTPNE